MSVGSISFTVINVYAAQSAAGSLPSVSASAAPSTAADASADNSQRPTGKRHLLVDAMMTALQELGLTGTTAAKASATTIPATTSAAPTDASAAVAPAVASTTATVATTTAAASATNSSTPTTPTKTDTGNTPSSSETLPQAVAQFAHALWSALNGAGTSRPSDAARGDGGGHAHRHHHAHRSHQGYDGLAQRLESLATANDPASKTTDSTSPAATNDSSPAGAAGVDTQTNAAATSPAASTHPLADAFGKLLTALRGGSAASAGDNATQLSRFLNTLAHALQPSAAEAAPVATGSLIDVTA